METPITFVTLLLLPQNSEPKRNAAVGTATTFHVPPGKDFFAPAPGMRTVQLVTSVAMPGMRASPPPGTLPPEANLECLTQEW